MAGRRAARPSQKAGPGRGGPSPVQDGVRVPGCHGILPHQGLAPPASSAQSGPSWFPWLPRAPKPKRGLQTPAAQPEPGEGPGSDVPGPGPSAPSRGTRTHRSPQVRGARPPWVRGSGPGPLAHQPRRRVRTEARRPVVQAEGMADAAGGQPRPVESAPPSLLSAANGGRRPRPWLTLFFFLLFLSLQDGPRSGPQPRPRAVCTVSPVVGATSLVRGAARATRLASGDPVGWTTAPRPSRLVGLSVREDTAHVPGGEACPGPPGSRGTGRGLGGRTGDGARSPCPGPTCG